jgi:hypothetical protein
LRYIVVDNKQVNLSVGKSGLAQWQIDQIVWVQDPPKSGMFQVNDKSTTYLVVPTGYQTVTGVNDCQNLVSAELPKTITGLQDNQFFNCLKMKNVCAYTM